MMNLIDRYVLRQLVMTFVFTIVALCVIFIVVNLIESLDNFLDHNASVLVIIKYYLFFLPEILKMLLPVAMLIATLFSIGKLSNLNEITAMKAGGQSLYRLMVPLIMLGIVVSVGQLYFNGWVVPIATKKKFEIEQKYMHENKTGGPIYNLYFRDTPTRNLIMQFYDAEIKTGNEISIDDFTAEKQPRLIKRTEAKRLVWDSVKTTWKLLDVIERNYTVFGTKTITYPVLYSKLNITHNQILQLRRAPEEMNYSELWDYITILKRGGKDVRKQLIEYYGNYAFPFANLIVILFGVPFASVRKKGGIAIQIGAAMIISFTYLVFSKISQTLGYSSNLDPILTGWLANIIFLFLGIFTIARTKT
jgi:lipopolysaccharide export system permease protein